MNRNLFVALIMCAWWSAVARAGEWPAFRHDVRRSNATEDRLPFPLRLQWRYQSPQPPAPAFAEPINMINRVDFDYAPQPVAADGIVCFGSSADDTVRALDAATGRERWHFVAGGPVRVAPQIAAGRVYFGADDGFVYCLDVNTGKLLWTFRAAPRDERFFGNHRMISRWPVRSGVLVDGGAAYCVAGMWPSEGVYVYALDAATGTVRWCNDTAGSLGMFFVDSKVGNHQGEYGDFGLFPQGPLLANAEVLLVPSGNNVPTAFDRRSGRIRPWKSAANQAGAGGTWITIDQDRFHIFSMHRSDQLMACSFSFSKWEWDGFFRAHQIPQLTLLPTEKPGKIHTLGKVSALVHQGKITALNAYELARAGDSLLVGEQNAIRATDAATGKERWRAEVRGQARGIAVADGRLFVTTDQGEVSCFAADERAVVLHDPAAAQRPAPNLAPTASAVIEQLRSAGMDRGCALIFGDDTGELSHALAVHTELHVVNVQSAASAAEKLREKFLAETRLLGTRIVVQTVDRIDRLPFSQFCANAVIVAGPGPAGPVGLSGNELYRVLRPCGGVVLFPGLTQDHARTLAGAMASLGSEVRVVKENPRVVRGKLPGALDWNSKDINADQRVKWPLRPLWFGGPTIAQTQIWREEYQRQPIFANGRYFVEGETSLTAVDAYNGSILWSRPLPRKSQEWVRIDGLIHEVGDVRRAKKVDRLRSLLVDDDHVYLSLAEGYFRGEGQLAIQLDARTGRQKKLFGPYIAPPQEALNSSRTWPLEIDADHAGAVTLEPAADRLIIKLATTDPVVTPLDAWELSFDFRPLDSRYGLYDPGAFRVRVTPARGAETPAVIHPSNGTAHPPMRVAGTAPAGRTETILELPWAEVQRLTGAALRSFGFAVTLTSHDGKEKERIIQRHLFGDSCADGINNGWTNFLIGKPAGEPRTPAIIAGPSLPRSLGASSNKLPKTIDAEVAAMPRVHPLTGEIGLRLYRSGNSGCGLPDFSAAAVFRRAGGAVLGIYDFEDDSGLRSFSGIKAGCSTPRFTGLGLVVLSEETGHCVCNHFFRTSIALAPAERRLHEDWALFYERAPDTLLRKAAVNLGAPGDRRDGSGQLWLGYPRPGDLGRGYVLAPGTTQSLPAPGDWPRHEPSCLSVPLDVELFSGDAHRPDEDLLKLSREMTTWVPNRSNQTFGPYRVNADHADLKGTDRPWLYASGYRGIKKATLQVHFLAPIVSQACTAAPALDGQLTDAIWAGKPQAVLPETRTEFFFRHDEEHLFVAAHRPAVIDERGQVVWGRETSGEDADIWKDDSLELFLGGAGKSVVHLGVSASGARFGALGLPGKTEDRGWDGRWRSAVRADDRSLVFELAIPWKTLTDAGLDRRQLGVNFQMNQKDVSAQVRKFVGGEGRNWRAPGGASEAFLALGNAGRKMCGNFAPLGLGETPPVARRRFTVRLHFAELDDVRPGQRVFDVKLQGRLVLKDFDIVKEAGGGRRALVKEVTHVEADKTLTLEFIPSAGTLTGTTAPILSAFEVLDESPSTP